MSAWQFTLLVGIVLFGFWGNPLKLRKQANLTVDTKSDYLEAAKNGETEKVEKYLQKGIFADLSSDVGTTALGYASANGHFETVKLLTEHGSNPNQKNLFGTSPLLLAICNNRRMEMIHHLISKGARLKVKDYFGTTPMMCAAETGNVDLVRYLLKNKQGVNAKNRLGQTALFFAVREGKYNTVKLLLRNGANAMIRDQLGATPVKIAMENNRIEIAKLLKEKRLKTKY